MKTERDWEQARDGGSCGTLQGAGPTGSIHPAVSHQLWDGGGGVGWQEGASALARAVHQLTPPFVTGKHLAPVAPSCRLPPTPTSECPPRGQGPVSPGPLGQPSLSSVRALFSFPTVSQVGQ